MSATGEATRVAAITGGAGVIGTAIASMLADRGHTIAILDLDTALAGHPSHPPERHVPVDLADEGDVRRGAQALLERFGRVDVLVHAAAAFARASLSELDGETWRRVQAVNVESAVWLCQSWAPVMAQSGFGRIVMIASDTIWEPPSPPAPEILPYIASKAALVGIARALARTLGGDGITVNCVAPGLTRTPATERTAPPQVFEHVRSQQAVPRTLVPDDVAATVAFLSSDAASAITGQVLCTDGGRVLR